MSNTKTYNFQSRLRNLVPVLDTVAYATGDVLAVPTAFFISDAASGVGQLHGRVRSITIIDTDGEDAGMDIVIASQEISLGALNGAAAISAEDAQQVTAVVSIVAADYVAIGDKSIATLPDVNVPIHAGETGQIWVGLIVRDAATFSADGLTLRMEVQLDNNGFGS